jgi:hypothetical protein
MRGDEGQPGGESPHVEQLSERGIDEMVTEITVRSEGCGEMERRGK